MSNNALILGLVTVIIIAIVVSIHLQNLKEVSMANAGLQQCVDVGTFNSTHIIWKKECPATIVKH